MDRFETWLRKNYRKLRESYRPNPEGQCLTEEDMACLLDRKLNRKERNIFLAHFAFCSDCAQSFKESMLLHKTLDWEALPEVPKHIVERAQAIVASQLKEENKK